MPRGAASQACRTRTGCAPAPSASAVCPLRSEPRGRMTIILIVILPSLDRRPLHLPTRTAPRRRGREGVYSRDTRRGNGREGGGHSLDGYPGEWLICLRCLSPSLLRADTCVWWWRRRGVLFPVLPTAPPAVSPQRLSPQGVAWQAGAKTLDGLDACVLALGAKGMKAVVGGRYAHSVALPPKAAS